jgi:glycosyltransferase involved in cell wall biosynthesis
MKISIITICKNSSKTIVNTIESILSQKSDDVEYIVVDGASTDNTINVVHGFNDAIDTFVSEPDDGISEAFNKGISLAKGEVVGLINSDDSLLPDTIQKVVDYFEEHSDVQVLHGDILLYKGARFVKRVKPAGRWWYPWRLVLFNHPATFVRKSVYDKYGIFSLNFKIAMDVEIYLRWIKSDVKIRYLEEPLVVMHYGGLSDSQPFEGYRESRIAFLKHGYSWFIVYPLYVFKLVLHCVGRLHASFLLLCRRGRVPDLD